MKSATKKTQKSAPKELAFAVHRDPLEYPTKEGVSGDIVIETTNRGVSVSLVIDIAARDVAIANGDPIPAALMIPNYEMEDPTSHEERVAVNLYALEDLAASITLVVQEARRLGVLPAPASAA